MVLPFDTRSAFSPDSLAALTACNQYCCCSELQLYSSSCGISRRQAHFNLYRPRHLDKSTLPYLGTVGIGTKFEPISNIFLRQEIWIYYAKSQTAHICVNSTWCAIAPPLYENFVKFAQI